MQNLQKELANVMRQMFDLSRTHPVKFVTTQLLIRGTGRIEAQQEHLDGKLRFAGKSVTVSCIMALTQQRGTLFHDFDDGKCFPAGVNCCPLLQCGEFVLFDPDKTIHQGHLQKWM